MTPISQNRFFKQVGFDRNSQQANISYICWWCDAVDLVASSPGRTTTSKQILDELLGSAQWKTKDEAEEQTEPNEPPMAESESQTSAS